MCGMNSSVDPDEWYSLLRRIARGSHTPERIDPTDVERTETARQRLASFRELATSLFPVSGNQSPEALARQRAFLLYTLTTNTDDVTADGFGRFCQDEAQMLGRKETELLLDALLAPPTSDRLCAAHVVDDSVVREEALRLWHADCPRDPADGKWYQAWILHPDARAASPLVSIGPLCIPKTHRSVAEQDVPAWVELMLNAAAASYVGSAPTFPMLRLVALLRMTDPPPRGYRSMAHSARVLGNQVPFPTLSAFCTAVLALLVPHPDPNEVCNAAAFLYRWPSAQPTVPELPNGVVRVIAREAAGVKEVGRYSLSLVITRKAKWNTNAVLDSQSEDKDGDDDDARDELPIQGRRKKKDDPMKNAPAATEDTRYDTGTKINTEADNLRAVWEHAARDWALRPDALYDPVASRALQIATLHTHLQVISTSASRDPPLPPVELAPQTPGEWYTAPRALFRCPICDEPAWLHAHPSIRDSLWYCGGPFCRLLGPASPQHTALLEGLYASSRLPTWREGALSLTGQPVVELPRSSVLHYASMSTLVESAYNATVHASDSDVYLELVRGPLATSQLPTQQLWFRASNLTATLANLPHHSFQREALQEAHAGLASAADVHSGTEVGMEVTENPLASMGELADAGALSLAAVPDTAMRSQPDPEGLRAISNPVVAGVPMDTEPDRAAAGQPLDAEDPSAGNAYGLDDDVLQALMEEDDGADKSDVVEMNPAADADPVAEDKVDGERPRAARAVDVELLDLQEFERKELAFWPSETRELYLKRRQAYLVRCYVRAKTHGSSPHGPHGNTDDVAGAIVGSEAVSLRSFDVMRQSVSADAWPALEQELKRRRKALLAEVGVRLARHDQAMLHYDVPWLSGEREDVALWPLDDREGYIRTRWQLYTEAFHRLRKEMLQWFPETIANWCALCVVAPQHNVRDKWDQLQPLLSTSTMAKARDVIMQRTRELMDQTMQLFLQWRRRVYTNRTGAIDTADEALRLLMSLRVSADRCRSWYTHWSARADLLPGAPSSNRGASEAERKHWIDAVAIATASTHGTWEQHTSEVYQALRIRAEHTPSPVALVRALLETRAKVMPDTSFVITRKKDFKRCLDDWVELLRATRHRELFQEKLDEDNEETAVYGEEAWARSYAVVVTDPVVKLFARAGIALSNASAAHSLVVDFRRRCAAELLDDATARVPPSLLPFLKGSSLAARQDTLERWTRAFREELPMAKAACMEEMRRFMTEAVQLQPNYLRGLLNHDITAAKPLLLWINKAKAARVIRQSNFQLRAETDSMTGQPRWEAWFQSIYTLAMQTWLDRVLRDTPVESDHEWLAYLEDLFQRHLPPLWTITDVPNHTHGGDRHSHPVLAWTTPTRRTEEPVDIGPVRNDAVDNEDDAMDFALCFHALGHLRSSSTPRQCCIGPPAQLFWSAGFRALTPTLCYFIVTTGLRVLLSLCYDVDIHLAVPVDITDDNELTMDASADRFAGRSEAPDADTARATASHYGERLVAVRIATMERVLARLHLTRPEDVKYARVLLREVYLRCDSRRRNRAKRPDEEAKEVRLTKKTAQAFRIRLEGMLLAPDADEYDPNDALCHFKYLGVSSKRGARLILRAAACVLLDPTFAWTCIQPLAPGPSIAAPEHVLRAYHQLVWHARGDDNSRSLLNHQVRYEEQQVPVASYLSVLIEARVKAFHALSAGISQSLVMHRVGSKELVLPLNPEPRDDVLDELERTKDQKTIVDSRSRIGEFGGAVARLLIACGTEDGCAWLTGPGARLLADMKAVLENAKNRSDGGSALWGEFRTGINDAASEQRAQRSAMGEIRWMADRYKDKAIGRWRQIAKLELAMIKAAAPVAEAAAPSNQSEGDAADASSSSYIDFRSWLKEQRWLPPDVWDMVAVVVLNPEKMEVYRDGILPWLFHQRDVEGRALVPIRFPDAHAVDRLPAVYPLAVAPAPAAMPASADAAREHMFRDTLQCVPPELFFEPDARPKTRTHWRGVLTQMRVRSREEGTTKGTTLQTWIAPVEDADSVWLPYVMADDVHQLCQGLPTKAVQKRHPEKGHHTLRWLTRRMDPWLEPLEQTRVVVAGVIRLIERSITSKNLDDDDDDVPNGTPGSSVRPAEEDNWRRRQRRRKVAKDRLSATIHQIAVSAFPYWYSPTQGGLDSGSTMSRALAQCVRTQAISVAEKLARGSGVASALEAVTQALLSQSPWKPVFPATMCVGNDAHLQWYNQSLARIALEPLFLGDAGVASGAASSPRDRIIHALLDRGEHESKQRVEAFFDAHLAPALREFTLLRQRLKLEPSRVGNSDGMENISGVCIDAIQRAIEVSPETVDMCNVETSGTWWRSALVASQLYSPFAHRRVADVRRLLRTNLVAVTDTGAESARTAPSDQLVNAVLQQLKLYTQQRVDAGLDAPVPSDHLSGMVVRVLEHAFSAHAHYPDVVDALECLSVDNYSLHSLLKSDDPRVVNRAVLDRWSHSTWTDANATAFLRPWAACSEEGRRRVVRATRRGEEGDMADAVWPRRVFLDGEPTSELAARVRNVANELFTAFWANLDHWIANRSSTSASAPVPTAITQQADMRRRAKMRLKLLMSHTDADLSLRHRAVIGDPAPFAQLCIDVIHREQQHTQLSAQHTLQLLRETVAQLIAVSDDVFMHFAVGSTQPTEASPPELRQNRVYTRLEGWFSQGRTLAEVAQALQNLLVVISDRPFVNVRRRDESWPSLHDQLLADTTHHPSVLSQLRIHDQREGLPFAAEVLTCTLALAFRWNIFPDAERESHGRRRDIMRSILVSGDDASASQKWLEAVHQRARFWEVATRALQTLGREPPDLGSWTQTLSVNQHAKLVFLYDTALVHYMDLHAQQCAGAQAYDIPLFCSWYAEVLRIQHVLEVPDVTDGMDALHPEASSAMRDITDRLWVQNRVQRCLSHSRVANEVQLRKRLRERTLEIIDKARVAAAADEVLWAALVRACDDVAQPMYQKHPEGDVRIAVAHQATALHSQLSMGWNVLEQAYRIINKRKSDKDDVPQQAVPRLVSVLITEWYRFMARLQTTATKAVPTRSDTAAAALHSFLLQQAEVTGFLADAEVWRTAVHPPTAAAADMEMGARIAFMVNDALAHAMQHPFEPDTELIRGLTIAAALSVSHAKDVEMLQNLCVVIVDTVDVLMSFGNAVLRSSRGTTAGLLDYNQLAVFVSRALAAWIGTWSDRHPLRPLAAFLTWDDSNSSFVATKPVSALKLLRELVDDARQGTWTPSPLLCLWAGLPADDRSKSYAWTPGETELAALGAVDAALNQLQTAIDKQRTLQDLSVPAIAAALGEPSRMDPWSELQRHVNLLSKGLHHAIRQKVAGIAISRNDGVDKGLTQLILSALWPLAPMEPERPKTPAPEQTHEPPTREPPKSKRRAVGKKSVVDPMAQRMRGSSSTSAAPAAVAETAAAAAQEPVVAEAPRVVAAAAAAAAEPVVAEAPRVATEATQERPRPQIRKRVNYNEIPLRPAPRGPAPSSGTTGRSCLRLPPKQLDTPRRFVQIPLRYR